MLDTFFLQFKPSQVAAAAFILSTKQIKGVNAWNNEMEKWTKIKIDDEMTKLIAEVKKFSEEINGKFLPSL